MTTGEGPPASGTWVIDLDGVVWLTGEPIGDAGGAIRRLRQLGVRPLFVTNNSAPTRSELARRLRHCSIEAGADDVISSADAVATLLEPGSTALLLAEGGVVEALTARGVRVVDGPPADAVVVGWTHDFDFPALAMAASAVRAGARLLGTNEDATHPTPDGLQPGSGALLAAVAVASGRKPEVAGKPHRPIAALAGARADDISLVVGDRAATDGELAGQLGVPFALVLSGVTAPGDAPAADPAPAWTAGDLSALVDQCATR